MDHTDILKIVEDSTCDGSLDLAMKVARAERRRGKDEVLIVVAANVVANQFRLLLLKPADGVTSQAVVDKALQAFVSKRFYSTPTAWVTSTKLGCASGESYEHPASSVTRERLMLAVGGARTRN